MLLGGCRSRGEFVSFSVVVSEVLGFFMASRLLREEFDEEVLEFRFIGRFWLLFWRREVETGILVSLFGSGISVRFWVGERRG